MKVVQINAACGYGSTGKICVELSERMNDHGIENYIFHSGDTVAYANADSCASKKYIRMQSLKAHLFGNWGFHSSGATKKMIAKLDSISPDILHLHNIHGHDCNLEMLFSYIKEKQIKVIWTFHDCWAFTGYCTYFDMAECNKWQSRCAQCVQRRTYSWLFDRSQELFDKKKELFDGLDLTIVTPSRWLADNVRQSFLHDYPVHVIPNGINLDIFKPSPSDFRKKHGLEGKKILLGVSFEWERRKGIDVFIELAKRLPDAYAIVLVGTSSKVEKMLPENILAIRRTQNQQELAQIYSAADLFVNPTREDNFPTVNMEALACGIPGVTFNSGGSPECFDAETGSVVERNDVESLIKEIIYICDEKPYTKEACINRAKGYEKNGRYREYLELYERVNLAGTERN